MNTGQKACKSCGEPWIRHIGRSELCPYDRKGEFDYRAEGLAWPERSTYFEPNEESHALGDRP